MISRFDILIYLFILSTLSGCKKIDSPEQETNPGEQQVTLRLLMPQSDHKAGTYAISEVDKNSIHSLDVLAFRIADDGKEYYAYHRKAVLLRPNDNATAVDFHVDLLKSTDKFRFVMIANASVQLQNALSGLPVNTEKETLMNGIEYGITTRWNAGSSANFTPLPMWGESETIDGINNNTQKFTVNMLRSLAAIDVKVTDNDFVMTHVYVYNMPGKGRIAPVAGNYNTTDYKVTAPSIPAGTNKLAAQEYTAGTNTLAGEIFLFESTAAASTGDPNATGLVIAGKYAGSTTVTYYRVELTDNQLRLLPVLRNHRYDVNIIKVHGPGANSVTDAWASKPTGMTATVTAWNEIPVTEGRPSSQYLKSSIKKVELNGLASEIFFTTWTNVPNVTLDMPSWLFNSEIHELDDEIIYRIDAEENTSTTTPRTGKITIKAGRLTATLDVTQAVKPIDLGPDYGFYIVREDLEGAAYWDEIANVPYNLVSSLDASLTQKDPPNPNSCVALFGPGARLPTMYELRQLLPTDHNKRLAVNALIQARGGKPMQYNQATGLPNPYLSSTSASWLSPSYTDESFVTIRSNIGAAYAKDRKFTNQGFMNNVARCVFSKN
ncbi:BACON domain-containing protein [Sphingobacterium spiritivorum]|uniref:BACON domain-containing protein n=1 Tax=Sphingobacterium spiritivorum TaxID=258 RepID=UPI0036848131